VCLYSRTSVARAKALAISEDMYIILEFLKGEYRKNAENMFTGAELQQALDIARACCFSVFSDF